MNAQDLLQEIADYCRHSGLAESTFGRRAVNDGKLTVNSGIVTAHLIHLLDDNLTAILKRLRVEDRKK